VWLSRAIDGAPDADLGESMLRNRLNIREHWPRLTSTRLAAGRTRP